MLNIYNTLEEVPEALREHYRKSDGRYVPDLAKDHPVLVHNATLLSEKTTATNKIKELEADIAGASTIPRGHKAVPKADADLLDAYKVLGTPDEVKVKVTEHETLKADITKREREDKLVLAAKELGFDNVEAFKRMPNMPDFEIRDGKDGKKEVFALVKDGDKVIEKPAQQFLESSPDHSPFLPALKVTNGVKVNTTASTTSPKPGEPFAWAKQFSENYVKETQPLADPFKAFNERSSI